METEGILNKVTGGPKKHGSSYPWHWTVHQITGLKQQHKRRHRTWVQTELPPPSCSGAFVKDTAVKKIFSSPPQEGLSQEHTPVNGLELCTLPHQPFTYTPSAAAYL